MLYLFKASVDSVTNDIIQNRMYRTKVKKKDSEESRYGECT